MVNEIIVTQVIFFQATGCEWCQADYVMLSRVNSEL